ncbi:MAG TPA: hypothetical protein VK893_05500 [Pyrinomonadaceae bacterium]|nr:hypothetical protein [Pyrinomonadaceae bacterium]
MVVEQPHFDDERTVQSARPVVPLEQIQAKVKHRRRWFLGSAFALAMLLGAASALVSAYFKLRNASDPEIQTLSVSSVSELPLEAVVPTPEEQPSVTPKRPAPRVRNRDFTNHPVATPQLSEEEELERIRDAVLVDQWQERRQRRAERRERRDRRRAQHPDRDSERDLSNLNEIFEGRRRP